MKRVQARPACGLGPAWDPVASGREEGGPSEGERPASLSPAGGSGPRARCPRPSRGRVRGAPASDRPASLLPRLSPLQPVRAAA